MGQDHTYTMQDGAGVAEFLVADAIEVDLECVADELPDNPAHALINGNKTKSIQRHLKRRSTFKE